MFKMDEGYFCMSGRYASGGFIFSFCRMMVGRVDVDFPWKGFFWIILLSEVACFNYIYSGMVSSFYDVKFEGRLFI